jgi:crystallin alpha B
VKDFSPDELAVHFNSNNELIIEGNHEEKPDEHGYITRRFKRRYDVPSDIIEEKMVCSISSDGILKVHVPRVQQPKATHKQIPIVQTGEPAKKAVA